MLDNLETVTQLNFSEIIVGVVAILLVIKGIIELVGWLAEKCGITFTWREKRKADHKLLVEMNERLGAVEKTNTGMTSQDNELKEDIQKLEQQIEGLAVGIKSINDSVSEISERSINNEKATIEILYTMINQKCSHYINDLNGIPENDIKQFTAMFEAYSKIGGNHGLGAKVDYCLNRLPVLPSTDLKRTE